MDMDIPIYTVDAFTDTPFSGNQAAICLVDRAIQESTMQLLAAEMNISETAYIEFNDSTTSFKDGKYFKLRWFTPTNEVPLCGHATLAAAAVLLFECGNTNEIITFSTLSGDLTITSVKDKITMDFPKNEPVEEDSSNWEPLANAVLGKYYEHLESVLLSSNAKKLILRLNDECSQSTLQSISPDFQEMLKAHDGSIVKGIIVTLKGDKGYHFYSRYFAPWNGIPEDPVTGSAHTVLGPYWCKILGQKNLCARQCSKRGGKLDVLVCDSRVYISGSAKVIVKGKVHLPC
ncbi:phenazine biosynthesis-like domain-containing protein 1 [Styela clava]